MTSEMACVGATCGGGDVELREIPLSLPGEKGGVIKGDARRSCTADVEDEDDDEEAGLLGTPKARAPRDDGATASTSTPTSGASGFLSPGAFLSRLPKGEAVMFCGTAILAFQNIVAKTVERGVPPMQVVFIRSALSGAVTFCTVYHRHVRSATYDKSNPMTLETFMGPKEMWPLCAIRGVVGSIAFSLAYVSLTYLTVGDSVAIFFLNPIFSAFLAWPVLGERVGTVEAVAVVCGLLGTLLIVKPPAVFDPVAKEMGWGLSSGDAAPPNPTGVVITVFSAACCSIAMVTIRTIGKRVGTLSLAGWFHASSTVIGLLSCVARWPLAPVSPNQYEWSLLILLAATSFFGQVRAFPNYHTPPTHRLDYQDCSARILPLFPHTSYEHYDRLTLSALSALAELRVLAPAHPHRERDVLPDGGVERASWCAGDEGTDGCVQRGRVNRDLRRGVGAQFKQSEGGEERSAKTTGRNKQRRRRLRKGKRLGRKTHFV